MTTVLIDGDIVAYQCASSAEVETDWGDDLWTLHSNLDEAFTTFKGSISRIKEETKATDMILALSDAVNFRKTVLPTYKLSRSKTRKPLAYRPLLEKIKAEYNTYTRPGLEADDVLGILMTHPKIVQGPKVIWSLDKDLMSIPGVLYRGEERLEITEAQADHWHMTQTLTGDPTDGYAGCPGIGAVKAAKLLEGVADMWRVVVGAYTKAGLTAEDALVQARVARICRHQDYDMKKKEVILWTPKAS